ncbi:MAG TPA: sulfotransferase domain-containing protein, partial [Candidatus Mcinerneyibacterium sp.]|nr:sulfotransferase domain-containing protein [Candidatus Mcinerneyibacterium sp.]
MRKVDFAFVGPYRTGTTWLYEYFKNHSDVSVPYKVKETFFFDKNFENGYKWYFSHFKKNTEDKLTGDIAPSYFRSTKAAKRLLNNNPDIKIFFTLRDPVDRIISQYKHGIMKGTINQNDSI